LLRAWGYMRVSRLLRPLFVANGQRVKSTKVCGISFNVAQHDFVRTVHVLRDLRAADIVWDYHGWTMTAKRLLNLVTTNFNIDGWHCD
jgi:hypothetical protein